tara:strand:+ start:192 stop:995 length:804 start_codon:yes stop_codon:yes gene_type:complete
MITTTISGCVGEVENLLEGEEKNSPVGEWYMANEKVILFNANGTLLGDHETNEYQESGTWSINDDGTILNILWDGSNDDEGISVWFVIDGDWLFITEEQDSKCEVMTKNTNLEGMPDGWSSTIEALTYPSICNMNDTSNEMSSEVNVLFSFSGEDVNTTVSTFSNDTLVELTMTQGEDLKWSYLSVHIRVDAGQKIECSDISDDDGCFFTKIEDSTTSAMYWDVSESISISEDSTNLCDSECRIEVELRRNTPDSSQVLQQIEIDVN